jgi:5-(carboxyamino)imidazole ribonucleotide mutase
MPSGIPVATVALNGAANAGLLALRILGASESHIADRMDAYRSELEKKVMNTLDEPKKLNFKYQRNAEI